MRHGVSAECTQTGDKLGEAGFVGDVVRLAAALVCPVELLALGGIDIPYRAVDLTEAVYIQIVDAERFGTDLRHHRQRDIRETAVIRDKTLQPERAVRDTAVFSQKLG